MVNAAKTLALLPIGHALTAEEIPLVGNVDVRIADKGGVAAVRVPIGTDKYVPKQAMEVEKDGDADRLARCLTNLPGKQAAAHITIESLGWGTSSLERILDTGLSLEACRRADRGAQWAYDIIPGLPGAAEGQSFLHEAHPDRYYSLTSKPKHAILRKHGV